MAPALAELWPGISRPVIGMLHLPALPGSPRYDGEGAGLERRVLEDAQCWAEAGAHGLMLENFGDVPFFKSGAGPQVVAWMTALAERVRRAVDLPLGINVLRNDAEAALAIAAAVAPPAGGFIRVNVLCGARLTDQGIIEGPAASLLRLRRQLDATHIRILADVDVKHSAPLGPGRPIEEEVADTLSRGLADGLIVTGGGTGRATAADELTQVRSAAGGAPVLVGSGITADNLSDYSAADGFIVGSWAKRDGVATNPVDPQRAQRLMTAWRQLQER